MALPLLLLLLVLPLLLLLCPQALGGPLLPALLHDLLLL
jgi:hypothetical protein